MDHLDEKVIELSKTKILLLIAGSFVFVAGGIWMLQMDPADIASQRRFNSPLIVYGIGAASVLFFGLCGLFGIKKLFDKRPGLVLSSTGILDNSSGVSARLIAWSEVTAFTIFEIQKQKMLIIHVSNPEKYVEVGGPMKRSLNRMNLKLCGSPIAISSNSLKISFKELPEICNAYFEKYGGMSNTTLNSDASRRLA